MKHIFHTLFAFTLVLTLLLGLTSCGETPAPVLTVSEDGYWEIDGEKSELRATGEGSTSPEITVSDDGYWVVGGLVTDKRAVSYEEFVSFNPWTMIFAWCNLLILYFFLRKLLWKPVKKMIDDRQDEIDGMYADAEEKQKSAGEMQTEYREKLSHAEEESEQIVRTAVRKAQLKEEEILREADENARRALRRAEEQAELEKKRALNEVKDEVSGMAIEIASAVIGRDVRPEEHEAMIDDFIRDFGNEPDNK